MNRGLCDIDKLRERVRLHRMGRNARSVARTLRMSLITERRCRLRLEEAGLLAGSPDDLPVLDELVAVCMRPETPPEQERSSIERWQHRVTKLVEAGHHATAIHALLREEDVPFAGSVSAMRRLAAQINKARGPRPEDGVIQVQTPPGETAQVDFGYIGRVAYPRTGVARR